MAKGDVALARKLGISRQTIQTRREKGIPLDAPVMSREEIGKLGMKAMLERMEDEGAFEIRIYPTKPVNPFARMVV